MNFSQVFGEAKQFYDQLDPQQRQAVAQQFQQHFGNSGDPRLQQQAQSLDARNPDSQQLGQLHDYAQQADPTAFNRAMDHPDIESAMSQRGVTSWGADQHQDQQGGYQQGFDNSGPGQYSDRGGYQPNPGSQDQYDDQRGQRGGYQQGRGYGDQGGYQQGFDNSGPGQYSDRGGYQPNPGSQDRYDDQRGQRGDRDGYQQSRGYGDQGGYQQGFDNSGPGQYSDRGGYQPNPGDQDQYDDQRGQRGDRDETEGFESGGQYGQRDAYRRDQQGY